jgi:glutamate dehydrogenase
LPILSIQTTDLSTCSFPDYVDPFDSSGDTMAGSPTQSPLVMQSPSAIEQLAPDLKSEDKSRHPSPQPTHFNVSHPSRPNGNGHRMLRSATVGYLAPEFKGKAEQMKQGMPTPSFRLGR